MPETTTRSGTTNDSIAARIKQNTVGLRLNGQSLTGAHWVAVSLAATTGAIHLYLYWTQDLFPFLLAGIGFFGAIGILLTTFSRRLLYGVGILYTAVQILIWVAIGMPSFVLGVFDKAVQVLLIGLLSYFLWRRSS